MSEDNVIRWCEISDRASRARFEALSAELTEAGVANEVSFVEVSSDDEAIAALESAKNEFSQIRLGGRAGELVLGEGASAPSAVIKMRMADSIVQSLTATGAVEWWPRNFITDGLASTFAAEAKDIDFGGTVFVFGAAAESRAAIAALVRIGFNKISLSDPDDERAELVVNDARKVFFGIQFSAVARHLVTQLPGVGSVALNLLSEGYDAGMLEELMFFNYLRPQGVWLDLALEPHNLILETEAASIGAVVLSSAKAYAHADLAWAKSCFGVDLDFDAYVARLSS